MFFHRSYEIRLTDLIRGQFDENLKTTLDKTLNRHNLVFRNVTVNF